MTVIYLLIEESFRELAARQMIAQECLAEGFEVVIAQQWWFAENLQNLPAGIVLFKGNNKTQATLMAAAKRLGHVLTSIEEEAFGTTYVPELETLFDPLSLVSLDLLFVQGQAHRDFVTGVLGADVDIAIVGNPRTDILMGGVFPNVLRKANLMHVNRPGFVLVNTNYAGVNPYDIDTYSFFLRCLDVGVMDPTRSGQWERFDSLMAWEQSNLRSLCRFIHGLLEIRPSTNIVIRPHPSENPTPWERHFGSIDTVEVVNDRDHLSWILASQVIVHTSCTTGLEAALLGKPVVGICSDEHSWHKGFISNEVGSICKTDSEAVHAVISLLEAPTSEETDFNGCFDKLHSSLMIDPNKRLSQWMMESFKRLAKAHPRLSASLDTSGRLVNKNTLGGRRLVKAFVDLDDFCAQLKSLSELTNNIDMTIKVDELAPSVFLLRNA